VARLKFKPDFQPVVGRIIVHIQISGTCMLSSMARGTLWMWLSWGLKMERFLYYPQGYYKGEREGGGSMLEAMWQGKLRPECCGWSQEWRNSAFKSWKKWKNVRLPEGPPQGPILDFSSVELGDNEFVLALKLVTVALRNEYTHALFLWHVALKMKSGDDESKTKSYGWDCTVKQLFGRVIGQYI
jgi:hypothetical protein